MKRLTLLTILLVVVGLTAGFALEVKPSFELSGSGTLEWGVDLDTGYTGFLNSAEADLTVTLLAEDGEDTHKGDGDWYGEITISDVEVWFEASLGTAPTLVGDGLGVEAVIVGLGGDLKIGVYDAPDLAADFVGAIEADEDAEDDVVDDESAADVGVDYGTYGTFLSYNVTEDIMVGLEVVSEIDWTANSAQAYAFALDVQAKFAPITIDFAANYGINYAANPFGVGVKVSADTEMVDGWLGADASYETDLAWEVGAGATFTLMETVTAELGVVYGDPQFDNLDAYVAFTEPGDAGLVDKFDASLTVYVLDIIGATDLEYEVVLAAGYDMGKLYPHFGVTYGDPNEGTDDALLTAYVHVDYELFEAAPTTLFLEWDSGNLLAPEYGTLVAGVTVEY